VTQAEPGPGALVLTAGAATDVGRRRRVNEDSMLCAYPAYVVADGMGGHDAGDVASAAAVRAFLPLVGRHDVTPEDVVGAVELAHAVVGDISGELSRGAGTTLVGLVIVVQGGEQCWMLVNVGDSRVYRLFDHELEQLTVDHSMVQELVDLGRLAPEEAATHSGRNVITRAIGTQGSPPDYWLMPIVTGERFLVCTDGLTGELDNREVGEELARVAAPQVTAERLVDAAVRAGGRDNVTALVVDVVVAGHDE